MNVLDPDDKIRFLRESLVEGDVAGHKISPLGITNLILSALHPGLRLGVVDQTQITIGHPLIDRDHGEIVVMNGFIDPPRDLPVLLYALADLLNEIK